MRRERRGPPTGRRAEAPSPYDSVAADVLLRLLVRLKSRGYHFIVPTPETHRRILDRDQGSAATLRDVFGWNRDFAPELLDDLFEPLKEAGLLEGSGTCWRSRVRVASLGDDLLLHSSYPTGDPDSVFVGPDSYRFARLLRGVLSAERFHRAIDMGGGAGAGAFTLTRCASIDDLVVTDINPAALFLAEVNARAADVHIRTVPSEALDDVSGEVDLIVANPPFIADSGRTYSDGGELRGAGAALKWACTAVRRLAPTGKFVMYTGSPVIGGVDLLRDALNEALQGEDASLEYEEIDPDIFGEELTRKAYAGVERIAAVSVLIQKA